MNPDNTPVLRLLYLTCTEQVVNYGLFDTQVKSLLKVLAKNSNNSTLIHLFSLVPILRLLKWKIEVVFLLHRESFRALQQEMAVNSVQTSIRPLFSTYPFNTWQPIEMIIALPWAVIMLATYVHRHRINLLHCRSYHAGLLGLIIQKTLGIPYIFDPRSPWVEEQILIGKWFKGSITHRLWQRLEVLITRNAFACIAVSAPLKDKFAPIANRVEIIHTTASEKYFNQADEIFQQFPKKNDLEHLRHSYKIFVFNVDSFNKWNSLDHLLGRYKELSRIAPKSVLVIITRTARSIIDQAIMAHSLDPECIFTMSTTSDLVPAVLRQCNYGLLVMPNSIRAPFVMSVKFAEYLAAGLPVICDEYVGGAAHVIKQHQVGLLLTSDWIKNQEGLERLQSSYAEVSARCRRVAEELFSVQVHARKYAQLYREAIA